MISFDGRPSCRADLVEGWKPGDNSDDDSMYFYRARSLIIIVMGRWIGTAYFLAGRMQQLIQLVNEGS